MNVHVGEAGDEEFPRAIQQRRPAGNGGGGGGAHGQNARSLNNDTEIRQRRPASGINYGDVRYCDRRRMRGRTRSKSECKDNEKQSWSGGASERRGHALFYSARFQPANSSQGKARALFGNQSI